MNRHEPIRRCGKQYLTQREAQDTAVWQTAGDGKPRYVTSACACGWFHVRVIKNATGLAPVSPKRGAGEPARRARETGFSRKVKLQIRARAGNGDPSQARCEAHGDFLGLHGGECQHIVARGMGGTSDPIKNTAANGALLCRPAHMLAEARDRDMLGMGFWLPQGTDPRLEPMMLHGAGGGGCLVWRSEDGAYLLAPPDLGAAA